MQVEKDFPIGAMARTRRPAVLRELGSGWLAGALLVAAALKSLLLLADAVPFNADEAVVALMARHILQGARPVFFYGQAYMGSLDAYLVAAGFRLFGESVGVLRLVQILLFLGTLATTAALGKAVFGSRQAGLFAAWFLSIPAVNVTLYTTATLGGYGEAMLLGNLILLAALRIATILSASIPPPPWLWLAFGFLSGLGLWAFGLTLVYSVPSAIFLAWSAWKTGLVSHPAHLRIPAALRPSPLSKERAAQWAGWAGWAAAGVMAGASPWWSYALVHGPGSLISELAGAAIASVDGSPYAYQILRHSFNLVVLGLPAALGLRPPWEVRWLALPLMPFALAFWLGVAVFSIRRLARPNSGEEISLPYSRLRMDANRLTRPANITQAPVCRVEDPGAAIQSTTPRWLIAGVVAALFAGFLFTPFGVDPSGRYFLPLAVVMALFGADTVLHIRRAWGRWAYAPVALVLAFNAWGTLDCALRNPPGLTTQFDAKTRIDHRYDPALMRFLLANAEQTGYSTYWVAYPLAFLSEEALIFVPDLPYHLDFRHTTRDNRYEPYARQVAAAGRAAYITANHPALDLRLRESFTALSLGWTEQQIGDYRVFYSLSRHVRPDELDLAP
jgi:hypothetical protein